MTLATPEPVTLDAKKERAMKWDWHMSLGRKEQLAPKGDWDVWFFMAGRGAGKTRSAAEDLKLYGLQNPKSYLGVCGPTVEDTRDVCFEGESGLVNLLPPSTIKSYNRSLGELILTNGTVYKRYSAEKPRKFRGPQFHRFWGDEIAEWRYPETWHNMELGLRLGRDPRAIATGTPKPVPLVRELYNDDATVITSASTYDNIKNLPDRLFRRIAQRYEGTSRGEQEILGKLLDELEGALWSRALLERTRLSHDQVAFERLEKIVIGVDPQGADDEEGSETGIIVAGKAGSHAYVLEDLSGYHSPDEWSRLVIDAYHSLNADRIIAEKNMGGAMVKDVLRTRDGNLPIKLIHAKRGKHLRAEPVVSLYEQGRVHHVGTLPDLEAQQTTFTIEEKPLGSDRVDADVYAISDLLLKEKRSRSRMSVGEYAVY